MGRKQRSYLDFSTAKSEGMNIIKGVQNRKGRLDLDVMPKDLNSVSCRSMTAKREIGFQGNK